MYRLGWLCLRRRNVWDACSLEGFCRGPRGQSPLEPLHGKLAASCALPRSPLEYSCVPHVCLYDRRREPASACLVTGKPVRTGVRSFWPDKEVYTAAAPPSSCLVLVPSPPPDLTHSLSVGPHSLGSPENLPRRKLEGWSGLSFPPFVTLGVSK